MLGVIKATGYSIFSKYLFKTKGGYLKLLPPMLHPVHLLNRFCKGVAHLLSNICPLPSDYAKYAVQLLQLCICAEHLCHCVFSVCCLCVCALCNCVSVQQTNMPRAQHNSKMFASRRLQPSPTMFT